MVGRQGLSRFEANWLGGQEACERRLVELGGLRVGGSRDGSVVTGPIVLARIRDSEAGRCQGRPGNVLPQLRSVTESKEKYLAGEPRVYHVPLVSVLRLPSNHVYGAVGRPGCDLSPLRCALQR